MIVLKGNITAYISSTLPHLANDPGHETNVVQDGDNGAQKNYYRHHLESVKNHHHRMTYDISLINL